MAISALISAWLAGLLGGAHCVAMCGGFVAALGAPRESGAAVTLRSSGALVLWQLPYHAGRISIRYAAAALLTAFAGAGIYRALFGPMATGQGPFCIVP